MSRGRFFEFVCVLFFHAEVLLEIRGKKRRVFASYRTPSELTALLHAIWRGIACFTIVVVFLDTKVIGIFLLPKNLSMVIIAIFLGRTRSVKCISVF